MADSIQKTCPKCAVRKPLSDFHRDAASPDGHRFKCKACANRDAREYAKARYDASPEAERQRARSRYLADPGKAAARTGAWARQNPDRVRASTRAWQKRNPEKVQLAQALRRARESGARVGAVNLEALWSTGAGVCPLCDSPIDRARRWPDRMSPSLDHIVPLSRGGTHEQSNVQWTHLVCNIRKGAKAP